MTAKTTAVAAAVVAAAVAAVTMVRKNVKSRSKAKSLLYTEKIIGGKTQLQTVSSMPDQRCSHWQTCQEKKI